MNSPFFVSDFEQGEIGPDLFRQACKFGLEGMVSKRRESTYSPGRSPNWIKVKNRSHPALDRVKEALRQFHYQRYEDDLAPRSAVPPNELSPFSQEGHSTT
jgi:hypothetical protein